MVAENTSKKPEILVFAGPNGSGKTTITRLAKLVGVYINADDIKAAMHCTDLEAAQKATAIREQLCSNRENFTFETVLSTDRNLELLHRAKECGYFIRCVYVLTANANINVSRVMTRAENGGHSVPEEKIRTRYVRALQLLPQLVEIADIIHIYDNSLEPFRIFKKRKTAYFYWENVFWEKEAIQKLTGVQFVS